MRKKWIAGLLTASLVASTSLSAFATEANSGSSQQNTQSGSEMGTPPDGAGGGNGTPPDGAGGGNGSGGPGGSSSDNSSITYSGATEITTDTEESDSTYDSTTGSQNALLVSGGTSTLTGITVKKSGDSSEESADFYGTNAAVFVNSGAELTIKDSEITTDGSHANAVFAYGTGILNILDSTIKTSANNSGGVMVTGGGTLNAENLTVTTEGQSSASIRSDRGGGTLTVTGGTYTTNGVGSPAIYSTADITVSDATLTATASEGAIVEGANSITMDNVTLTDSNTTLNGQSETYKNIFLYQSMSGDADEGTASFSAKDSKITTNNGDTIFVTNTKATIDLENNTFVNNDEDGIFLRIQAGAWGNSGSNGGTVTLNATNQDIDGDIYADDISTLTMSLAEGSNLKGAIDSENKAKQIDLTMDATSTWTLTADSYVDSLEDALSDYSNINLNGFTLYVNGEAITSTDYDESIIANQPADSNTDDVESSDDTKSTAGKTTAASTDTSETEKTNTTAKVFAVIGAILAVIVGFFIGFRGMRKSDKKTE